MRIEVPWPERTAKERHRPPHLLGTGEAVFVTAATLKRARHLASAERRDRFLRLFGEYAASYSVAIGAWVILADHYHAIVQPEDPDELSAFLKRMHSEAARVWNEEDGTPGRACWYQFWDTTCGRRATPGAGSTTSMTIR